MAYEPKPGNAVAYAKRDSDSERAPDYKGSIIAHRDIRAGEKISLALWWKGEREPRFLAGQVADWKESVGKPAPAPAKDLPARGLDDDIPF